MQNKNHSVYLRMQINCEKAVHNFCHQIDKHYKARLILPTIIHFH